MSSPKVGRWRKTLDDLLTENDKDIKWLCDYIGAAYNENSVSFYEKLPKKRTTYIGIGMAFHQPLDVINDWIADFAAKKKLYVKDISEDLVWIYLIQLNNENPDYGINYFQRYEECQDVAFAAYKEVWEDVMAGGLSTAEVEVLLDKEEHDQEFNGLTHFITSNIDSFKTAYSRPRTYLNDYVSRVFQAEYDGETGKFANLNRMRGYLEDSMVNYLSGDHATINTFDWKNRKRTPNIKYIPKSRKFHISLCLALGMTKDETNYYLDLMGYAPLSEEDRTEWLLIRLLEEWEAKHPDLLAQKERLLSSDHTKDSDEDPLSFAEYSALQEELLFLREELYNGFQEHGVAFPYMSK